MTVLDSSGNDDPTATDAPAELIDGEILTRKQWRKETR